MKAPQDIILKPVISERSIDLLPSGKYTFKVVNTMNCEGRTRRVGRFEGKKADWKKAIVTINQEPDDKKTKSSIEFFDGLY